MSNKSIVISKQGADHAYADMNNQDFVLMLPALKMVLDGCGTCKFSEVGNRLFAQLFKAKYFEWCQKMLGEQNDESIKTYGLSSENENVAFFYEENFVMFVKEVFANLINICRTDEFLCDNLCFTILACLECEDEFIVLSCGDGYILTDDGKEVNFIKLDDGEYPKYYAYNYVQNRENLQEYKDGVEFTVYHFSKNEYINVGVATDGLRFYEELNAIEKNKLFVALKAGKKGQIGMLINRNSQIFKDDISISF